MMVFPSERVLLSFQEQDGQWGLPERPPGAEPQPHRAGRGPHHEPARRPPVRVPAQPEHGAAPRTDQEQPGRRQAGRPLAHPGSGGAAAGTPLSRGRDPIDGPVWGPPATWVTPCVGPAPWAERPQRSGRVWGLFLRTRREWPALAVFLAVFLGSPFGITLMLPGGLPTEPLTRPHDGVQRQAALLGAAIPGSQWSETYDWRTGIFFPFFFFFKENKGIKLSINRGFW